MTAHDEAVKAAAEQVAAEAIRNVLGISSPAFMQRQAAAAAVAAAAPILLAAERQRIAAAIETAGRAEVEFLARSPVRDIDRARLIGAEDAWKAAVRIAETAP